MVNPLRKNYLRTHRRKLGLTQRQLAALLGLHGASRISCLERGQSAPTLREAIVFGSLFGTPVEVLWPSWTGVHQEALERRIRNLVESLQQSQVRSNRKRKRTNYVLRRLEALQQR